MSIAGPLTYLSMRHTNRATGYASIPRPLTNEERLRVMRQFWPIPKYNDFCWPQPAANHIGDSK